MFDAGYENTVSIDISSVVIERMQEQAKSKNMNIDYRQMDATQMDFEDDSFDAIIDKEISNINMF